MPDRLPKILRRREAVERNARWSFIGYPLDNELAERWPLEAPLRELGPDGVYVHRLTQRPLVVVHTCLCGHAQFRHSGDSGPCHRGCGCQTYREKAQP